MYEHLTTLCLDFDGTIMRYEDPPEHFHPDIVQALNGLRDHGVRWIANSGRTFEGQVEILLHTCEARGLTHWPVAIMSGECFIHRLVGDTYEPMVEWNDRVHGRLASLQQQLRDQHQAPLNALIADYAPAGVYYREEALVFQMSGEEAQRQQFIAGLLELLDGVDEAQLVQNGEWISIVDREVGKGNLLRAYLESEQQPADSVLAVGDHGNDISMLDGSVTPHVACPGNAYGPVQDVVRRVGGYVAQGHGPTGTLEAIAHYFADRIVPAEYVQ